MLEKTMKQALKKKVNKWIETIDDDNVKKTIKENLIITGGCFTSMLQNEKPNDYDCYFRTKEAVLTVCRYYVGKWNEAHPPKKNKAGYDSKVFVLDGGNPDQEILTYYDVSSIDDSKAVMLNNTSPERVKLIFPSDGVIGDVEAINASDNLGVDVIETISEIDEVAADNIIKKEKKEYFPVFISSNAITLSNGIQIVARFYGDPETIHETYDFVHTKAYYDFEEGEVVVPREVYEAIINKTLRYTGSLYPVCSVFRLRKFINRGWKINAGQMLKMCMQISELDLTDISVLEDQLVGLDSVYFMQLIEQFQKKQANDPTFVLDSDYLISIIDKIF